MKNKRFMAGVKIVQFDCINDFETDNDPDENDAVSYKKLNENRSLLSVARDMFKDFAANSSVHGLKYLAGRYHWMIKVFWILSFCFSIVTASILIYKTNEKWQTNPVIVRTDETPTSIWQIPFPAITVCPETKSRCSDFNITENYLLYLEKHPMNKSQTEKLEALLHVCRSRFFQRYRYRNVSSTKIIPLLQSMRLSLDEFSNVCNFDGLATPCSSYFSETLTDDGFCYTSNSLDSHDILKEEALAKNFVHWNRSSFPPDIIIKWTLEGGYLTKDLFTYPRRVLSKGPANSFTIDFKIENSDLNFLCNEGIQGFKVYFHNPSEMPRMPINFFRVPLKQDVTATVTPKMITTTEDLKDRYKPEERQCFFKDERNLKFFKIYTQSNCELECLTNLTLNNCGCVKFWMPRSSATKICQKARDMCQEQVEFKLLSDDLQHNDIKKFGFCNCLPSCTSITYEPSVSLTKFRNGQLFKDFREAYIKALGLKMNFSDATYSRLTIFFGQSHFFASTRFELYGFVDFVANCGGLLGLFMGVSILSMVEVLYYITVHLFCHRSAKRNEVNARKTVENNENQIDGNTRETLELAPLASVESFFLEE